MSTSQKTPVWFWIVAGLMLLWNLYGGMDYVNSVTVNETYLMALGEDLGPAFIEFLSNMPLWAKAAWGLAIGGAILGSLGLLLRKAWASKAFIFAFIAMIISFFYQLVLADKMPNVPFYLHIMTGVVFLVSLFEIWFAKKMTAKGILR